MEAVVACFLLRRTCAIPTSLRAWALNAQRIASTYTWSMFPGKINRTLQILDLGFFVVNFFV